MALSVPFPGNLYAALRCGQYIKKEFPSIKIALGGGYANTELRSLSDQRILEFVDFIKELNKLIKKEGNEIIEDDKSRYNIMDLFLEKKEKVLIHFMSNFHST